MHGERSTGRIRVDEQKQTETKQTKWRRTEAKGLKRKRLKRSSRVPFIEMQTQQLKSGVKLSEATCLCFVGSWTNIALAALGSGSCRGLLQTKLIAKTKTLA